jgi:hypothetical protein
MLVLVRELAVMLVLVRELAVMLVLVREPAVMLVLVLVPLARARPMSRREHGLEVDAGLRDRVGDLSVGRIVVTGVGRRLVTGAPRIARLVPPAPHAAPGGRTGSRYSFTPTSLPTAKDGPCPTATPSAPAPASAQDFRTCTASLPSRGGSTSVGSP